MIKVHSDNIKMSKTLRLFVRFNGLFEFVVICTTKSGDHRLVLDKHERGHGGDVVLHGDVLTFVYVNLEDEDIGVFLGEFLQFWGNHFAGSTPGGEKVDDDQLASCIGQFAVKVSLVFDGDDHFVCSLCSISLQTPQNTEPNFDQILN